MTLSFDFAAAAVVELEEAAAWYADKRTGLGNELLTEVVTAIDALMQAPENFPRVQGAQEGIRSVRVSRFPYRLVYKRKHGLLRILAVVHLKRRPMYWLDRADE